MSSGLSWPTLDKPFWLDAGNTSLSLCCAGGVQCLGARLGAGAQAGMPGGHGGRAGAGCLRGPGVEVNIAPCISIVAVRV